MTRTGRSADDVPAAAPRRRVLMSAYACGPGEGSEPGTGWQFAVAAAAHHDVWLLTRRRFERSIEAELAADPDLGARLRPVYVELHPRIMRWKRGALGVYWYYLAWQRSAERVARRLWEQVGGFDVTHHVTFASDWLPVGVRRLRSPRFVWGPVGGATYVPWSQVRWLGLRGTVAELVRHGSTSLARRAWGDAAARRSDLVVAHNDDVARRFGHRPVVVEPNPAMTAEEMAAPPAAPPHESPSGGAVHEALFVGRLVAWKGTRLAVAAVAHNPGWTLTFVGDGPDRAEILRRARRHGAAERVRVVGALPREEVLRRMRQADALLLPSLHDSASWVTAEAVTLGLPVVCVDLGGPPVVMDGHGVAVPPGRTTDRDLARALDVVLDTPREPSRRWAADRLPSMLQQWYGSADDGAGGQATSSS